MINLADFNFLISSTGEPYIVHVNPADCTFELPLEDLVSLGDIALELRKHMEAEHPDQVQYSEENHPARRFDPEQGRWLYPEEADLT